MIYSHLVIEAPPFSIILQIVSRRTGRTERRGYAGGVTSVLPETLTLILMWWENEFSTATKL